MAVAIERHPGLYRVRLDEVLGAESAAAFDECAD